jgi:iron complex outermembrane receptor protein
VSIVTGVVIGAVLACPGALVPPARGQEPTPKLPPTKVEGTVTPGEAPAPPPAVPPQPPAAPPPGAIPVPVSSGGIFASPPVSGYNATSATTGTIVNVPLIDFPGIVSVIPRDVINDQQILRVDDMLRDIPSAIKAPDNGFRPDSFLLRGFQVGARDYRWNGFQDFSPAPRDFANIQRVEILQGPASVLYGSGQPSGLVNFITKKPLDEQFVGGTVQGGAYGFFRTTADANAAMGSGPTCNRWLFRVNLAYENTESFRNFYHEERTLVAPSLTYVWDQDTALTYDFQYLTDRRLFDTGVAAIGGQPTSDPALIAAGVGVVGGNPSLMSRRELLNQPTDFQDFNDFKNALTLTHRFNDDWSARVGGFVGWHDSPFFATQPILFGNDPRLAPLTFFGVTFPPTTLLRQATAVPAFREQNYNLIADLAGKFETFGIKHNLVIGYEFDYFNSSSFTTYLSDPFTTINLFGFTIPTGASSPIDVFNPSYNVPTPPLPGLISATVTQARDGFYAQDLIELTPKWKLLLGARYDIVDEAFHEFGNIVQGGVNTPLGTIDIAEHSYFWSPRVGLVYQPVEEVVSLYGSYSESFDPAASGIFLPGTQLRPETGRCGEGGIKADLLDKKLSLSATGFYIVKDNVVTQTGFIFSEQIGRQRSQGCELSMVGRLTDRWSVIANYAYIDSRILDSVVAAEIGQRFRDVPFNSANVWTRYNLLQDCHQTFGLALGMVYNGDRPGDLVDSFSLPGYVRWDAGMYYQRGRLNASLYFENIFDRTYYAGSLNDLAVFPGNAFTMRASVGITF